MADFFQQIDAMGVAERHAQRVFELEESQAEKMQRIYRRVAKKLRARLSNIPRDTFTAQQLRVTLIQIEAAILQLEGQIREDIFTKLFYSVSETATEQTVEEVNEFNDYFAGTVRPVSLDAQLVAADYAQRLFNQYDVSLATYGQSLRNKIAIGIQDMTVEGVTNEQMYDRLIGNDGIGRFFDGEEWRLRRIVRTEMHNVYGGAKQNALEKVVAQESDIQKTLYHPMDSRTGEDSEYAASLRLIVPVSQPFYYEFRTKTGKLITRTFMHPPDRPNDRSIMVPYHPSWK